MSLHQRKSNSLYSKNILSTIKNTKDNCLYKKEILNSLHKLPLKINKDRIIKLNLNKNYDINTHKKDKSLLIKPMKKDLHLTPLKYQLKQMLLNKRKIDGKDKNKNNNLIENLNYLFNSIYNSFYSNNNYSKECKEWIDLFYKNSDYIFEKTNAQEFFPLIKNSMNLMLISIILLYLIGTDENENLFKININKILNNFKLLCQIIFDRFQQNSDINLKEKSNLMTNLYKNIINSVNNIILKYDEINSSLTKEFSSLLKKINGLNFMEIYNFYMLKILNERQYFEKKLKKQIVKGTHINNIINNPIYQKYKDSSTKKKININENKLRGLSMDYVKSNHNNIYNNYEIISSPYQLKNSKSTNLLTIQTNNIYNNEYSPYKNINNLNYSNRNNITNYPNTIYNNYITEEYSNNGNIYNSFRNDNENSANIIIKEITIPNHSNLNSNEGLINQSISSMINYENNKLKVINNYDDNNTINNNSYFNTSTRKNYSAEKYYSSRNFFDYYGNKIPQLITYRNNTKNRKILLSNIISKNISSNINSNSINNSNLYINVNNDSNNKVIGKIQLKKNFNKLISNKVSLPIIPFSCVKEYCLIINLDETLIYFFKNTNTIYLRHGLRDFLKGLMDYYELIAFANNIKNYIDQVTDFIENGEQYFTFRLHLENSTYLNEEYFKDINKLGRDIKKTIIIDNKDNENKNKENKNEILIKPFIKKDNDKNIVDNDYILYNLIRILIKIANEKPDDIRNILQKFKDEIENKVN